MAYRSSGRTNTELAENMYREDLIRTRNVLSSFLAIDRGHFLPPECNHRAYIDEPVRAEHGHFHLSAPHLYASVMEALDLSEGLSFLNIGSGTGYLSFLVAYIIGNTNDNHGIEQHQDLVEFASLRCTIFPSYYKYNFIKFRHGDAFKLATVDSKKKYDRIYVGGGVSADSSSYFKDLLEIGGIMVVPREDELVCITRLSQEDFSCREIIKVNFEKLKQPDENLSRLIRDIDLSEPILERVSVSKEEGISIAKIVRV